MIANTPSAVLVNLKAPEPVPPIPADRPEIPHRIELSVILPCLNEEPTLAQCVSMVNETLRAYDAQLTYEILVADNRSQDNSVKIAESLGARVISVMTPGYGATVAAGLEAASGRYLIFADSDSTYFLEDCYRLYTATVNQNADLGIASRLSGRIEKGAMPWAHRYLGTPVLTLLINRFYRGQLSDCNSGFRCVRAEALKSWKLKASGMEYATEMIIKSLKSESRVIEISSGLNCGPQGRKPHLRTWRDGMRHLLLIFGEAPQIVETAAFGLMIVPTLLQVASVLVGPVDMIGMKVLDVHTQAMCLGISVIGAQLYIGSGYLFTLFKERPGKILRRMLDLNEGLLLLFLLFAVALPIAFFSLMTFQWISNRFSGLSYGRYLFPIMHLSIVPGLLAIGMAGLHMFKRRKG